jgi:hypothetical protein
MALRRVVLPAAAFLLPAVLPVAAQKALELCAACHQTQTDDFSRHAHMAKGLSCDTCHGASKEHRESTGQRPPDRVAGPLEMPALCGSCHTGQAKDYKAGKHWQMIEARKRSASCATCHSTHTPRAAKAIEAQCTRCHDTRPAACGGKPRFAASVSCAGCHNQHSLAQLPRI